MTRTNSNSGECSSPSTGQGRTPEMSLYDRERKPHKLLTDATEVLISPRSLDSELMCPICLDMLNGTMTTKECLHRFCHECITTALRNGNKECPTCRKKLVSRRSLRPDPNFDALIKKIYPNREEYDEIQKKAFARLSQHSCPRAFQAAMEEGTRHQAQLRKMKKVDPKDFEYMKRPRKRKAEASAGDAEPSTARQLSFDDSMERERERESSAEPSASEASAPRHLSQPQPQEVELILRPQASLDSDEALASPLRTTRFLKTAEVATVDHIAAFVALRVRLDAEESARTGGGVSESPLPPASSFRIYVNPGIGSNKPFTLLQGSLTLAEVKRSYWKVKRPLELQFALATQSPNSQVSASQEKSPNLFASSTTQPPQ